jgi:cardiolipin synthase
VRRFAAWFEQEKGGASPYVASQPGLLRDAAEGVSQLLGLQL